jgi:HEPN domain-containing protein
VQSDGHVIVRTETEPWWRQAQADLETAEVVLRAQRFYAVSWFVQQAVEKGLKAIYVEQRGVLAPRTHDLKYLASAVSLPASFAPDIGSVDLAFEASRYPDSALAIAPVDALTEEQATGHLVSARRIFQWLARELGFAPAPP